MTAGHADLSQARPRGSGARGKFGSLFGPKLVFHFCVSPMRPSENFPPLLVRR
jgi:hypothetical protein